MASKVLVVSQFAALAALVWPWSTSGWNPWAWLPIVLALIAAGWTLLHNPPANFSIFPEPRAGARLVTRGPYALVRHPMYFALMVFGLGLALGWSTPVHWFALAVLAVVLDRKALREERFLRARFAEYDAYAARTPRLLPGFARRAR